MDKKKITLKQLRNLFDALTFYQQLDDDTKIYFDEKRGSRTVSDGQFPQ